MENKNLNSVVPIPETPRELPDVLDRNLGKAIDVFDKSQQQKVEIEKEIISIDKNILMVFSIALLGTLFFIFLMIAFDKLTPVTGVLYPILTAILGFMSGYFAGTGRVRGKSG